MATSRRRESIEFSKSEQQVAGDERLGLAGLRRTKERLGVAGFNDTSAMQKDNIAGEAARLAEIVGRHHHLDAARRNGADDALDRLGGSGVEARGRLVEKQHGRI